MTIRIMQVEIKSCDRCLSSYNPTNKIVLYCGECGGREIPIDSPTGKSVSIPAWCPLPLKGVPEQT